MATVQNSPSSLLSRRNANAGRYPILQESRRPSQNRQPFDIIDRRGGERIRSWPLFEQR